MSIRLKVVGIRRELVSSQSAPQVPGGVAPTPTESVVATLRVQSVNADGRPLTGNAAGGAPGMAGDIIDIRVENAAELANFTEGQIITLGGGENL